MINKKNLWFLTLFSLVLVLSVYYVTMPKELLITNNSKEDSIKDIEINETSIIEVLKENNTTTMLEEISKLKSTIGDSNTSLEDKNKAFDALKLLNQISSKEELLEEKIKNTYSLDSFIKIDGDEIRVVVDASEHDNKLANDIMRTIQSNFDTKQYIVVEFK